ncbi:hypothetical protein QBC39DRAFT_359111 [Podospora conica]|nr:hypothetical protein QBC39DRAFT_359111 [Schizothecium conicum]
MINGRNEKNVPKKSASPVCKASKQLRGRIKSSDTSGKRPTLQSFKGWDRKRAKEGPDSVLQVPPAYINSRDANQNPNQPPNQNLYEPSHLPNSEAITAMVGNETSPPIKTMNGQDYPVIIPLTKLNERLGGLGGLPITLPNGNKLYLHVEEETTGLSMGNLICATLAKKDGTTEISQWFSRLGGSIQLGDEGRFVMTTAHGIAGYLVRNDPRAAADTDTDSITDDDTGIDNDTDTGDTATDSDSDSDAGYRNGLDGSSAPALGYKDPATVDGWRPVSHTGAVNFLGQGAEAVYSDAHCHGETAEVVYSDAHCPEEKAETIHSRIPWWSHLRTGEQRFGLNSDFALLGNLGWFKNSYILDGVSVQVKDVKENVEKGPVHIIAGDGLLIEATLLAERTRLYSNDTWLETRKIKLKGPMGRCTPALDDQHTNSIPTQLEACRDHGW